MVGSLGFAERKEKFRLNLNNQPISNSIEQTISFSRQAPLELPDRRRGHVWEQGEKTILFKRFI
jgi:hypothetical protein